MAAVVRAAFVLCSLTGASFAQGAQFVARSPALIASQYLFEVAAADLDGDGDVDLCGGCQLLAPVRYVLLRNDGAGRFTDVSATLPPLPSNWATQVTMPFDMDGDGDLDLLLVGGGGARLLRNVGNLTFVDASANLPAGIGSVADVAAADLDGDGDLDLVMVGLPFFGGYSRVLVNQGNGVFAVSSGTVPPLGYGCVVADFDQDGDPDLAVFTGGLSLWRNDGNLLFTNVTSLWTPGLSFTGVSGLAVGDFDGNGSPDLWVASFTGAQHLRFVGGAFVVAGSLPGSTNGHSFVVADVDEDGDLDVVIAPTTGALQLAVNDGAGNFTLSPSRLSIPIVQTPIVRGGDLDGDGDLDLVIADTGASSSVVVNRHRDLLAGQPSIGQTWNVQVASEPGYAPLDHVARLAIAVAALPSPLAIPVFGDLWLDLGAGYVFFENVVFASAGQCTFAFAVPPAPALVGLPLHLQGLVEQARAPARFTAYFRVVVQ